MSHTELPASVDPYKLTEQGAVVQGRVPLGALGRVKPLLLDDEGAMAEVTITFTRDAENRRLALGELSASVRLQCQRCMESMEYPLVSGFSLAFVADDEQARNLPRELEPIELQGRDFDLWQVVEDELLLSLPPFPAHQDEGCIARLDADRKLESAEPLEEPASERHNPFEVLGMLKPALRSKGKRDSGSEDKS